MESTLDLNTRGGHAIGNSSHGKAPKSRWTLDELAHKDGYSSSKDLQRDIRKIYSLKHGHEFPTLKKTRRQKRKLPKISKSVSLQKKKSSSSSSCPKATSTKTTTTSIENLNPSSLNWRLGELMLTASLGDHLVELGRTVFQRSILKHDSFPKSWDSYRQPESPETTPVSSLEMTNIWLYASMAVGSLRSWHSGVIGQAALTNEPQQRFGESLLDLRSCGIARRNVAYTLVDKCLSVVHEASIIKEPTAKSLEIICLMVNTLQDFRLLPSRIALLELGINHFKYLLRVIKDKKEKMHVFQKFFDLYYTADLVYHADARDSGLPFLTVGHIQEMLREIVPEPMTYVDPEIFSTTPFPNNPLDLTELYWRQGNAMLYKLCVLRNHFLKFDISQIEFEDRCSRLVLIQQKIRQSRCTVFSRAPSFSKNKSGDITSLSYFTSVLGPEDIIQSHTLLSEESRNVFYLHNLVEKLTNRFHQSKIFPSLLYQLESMMDEQIKLNLELWEFVLNDFERSNQVIFSSQFFMFSTLIHSFQYLPRGWRYISKWKRKFPQCTYHITRLIDMWKFLSFGKAEYIHDISEYEDEEQIYSLCEEEPLAWLAFEQSPPGNIYLTPETIPSPDLSDFQKTLCH